MQRDQAGLAVRRVLLSVSDKTGIVELARAFAASGAELVATGRTASVLIEAGLSIIPIEEVSGAPEAFQGRMKTLSFPVCSGILYRRGDAKDEADLRRLKLQGIDAVVVNFYPFEDAVKKGDPNLVEQVDIGGPTLVRAAAKNSPDVLVLTSPGQYAQVLEDLQEFGRVQIPTVKACAQEAWDRVLNYDSAIAQVLGGSQRLGLRYGENPHQKGWLEFDRSGPIAWHESLTPNELSYNNILDVSSAYALASDLRQIAPDASGVVIVKHNNPCGVSVVPRSHAEAQKTALMRAWQGDPVSSFGGVLVFTDPIEEETAEWLSQHFVELVAAPSLTPESASLRVLTAKRKKLKALRIQRFGDLPEQSQVAVPGGKLFQTTDQGMSEELKSVTQISWPSEKVQLSRFGIAVCRALKSNAIAIVREIPSIPGALQLIGAGQGQPNRVEALKWLAVPRAQGVLAASEAQAGAVVGGTTDAVRVGMAQAVLVSDAFFPFRDTVDEAYAAGLRWIIQPGGSLKDGESIDACNQLGVAMAFTGTRHFRH